MKPAPHTVGWLEGFLHVLRCPDTEQPLRLAEAADLERHGLPEATDALVTADGSRWFPIEGGIPVLLPQRDRASGAPPASEANTLT